jgi:hypothetical protein
MNPVKREPPPRRIGKYDWDMVAELCINNPNEWIFVNNGEEKIPHSTYSALLRGKMRSIDPDKFDIRASETEFLPQTNGRRSDIYIRYAPDKKKGKK